MTLSSILNNVQALVSVFGKNSKPLVCHPGVTFIPVVYCCKLLICLGSIVRTNTGQPIQVTNETFTHINSNKYLINMSAGGPPKRPPKIQKKRRRTRTPSPPAPAQGLFQVIGRAVWGTPPQAPPASAPQFIKVHNKLIIFEFF